MQFGDNSSPDEVKLDMTPMIDVVFQLLIFFMCTIKFRNLDAKLSAYLPRDVGVNSAPAAAPFEKLDIVISVLVAGSKLHPLRDEPYGPSSSGPFRYGPDRRLQFQAGATLTSSIEELSARLKEIHASQPTRPATIDPRAGTTYADMLLVLDAAMAAGFREIGFKASRQD